MVLPLYFQFDDSIIQAKCLVFDKNFFHFIALFQQGHHAVGIIVEHRADAVFIFQLHGSVRLKNQVSEGQGDIFGAAVLPIHILVKADEHLQPVFVLCKAVLLGNAEIGLVILRLAVGEAEVGLLAAVLQVPGDDVPDFVLRKKVCIRQVFRKAGDYEGFFHFLGLAEELSCQRISVGDGNGDGIAVVNALCQKVFCNEGLLHKYAK